MNQESQHECWYDSVRGQLIGYLLAAAAIVEWTVAEGRDNGGNCSIAGLMAFNRRHF